MAAIMLEGYFRGGRMAMADGEKHMRDKLKRARSNSPTSSNPATPTKRSRFDFDGPSTNLKPGAPTAYSASGGGLLLGMAQKHAQAKTGFSPPSTPTRRTSKPPIIVTHLDEKGNLISSNKRTVSTASTNVPEDRSDGSNGKRQSRNSGGSYVSRSSVPDFMSSRNSWRANEGTSPAWGLPMSPKIGALPPLPQQAGGVLMRSTSNGSDGTPLQRTSSHNSPTSRGEHVLSDANRAHMRNKLLDVLENPDDSKEERWIDFIDDIVQLGPNAEAIYDLYQVPITRRILEKTEIGKHLQSDSWKRLAGSDRLVKIWKGEIKKRSGNVATLEQGIFAKHNTTSTTSEQALKSAGWNYTQDVRSILSILKKDYNEGVRENLARGLLDPDSFLDDFYQRPDVFESPAHALLRAKSKEEADAEDGVNNIEDKFPQFDSNLTCSNCKATGCYYKVLALDESNYSRECKCQDCKYEWIINE